MAGVPSECEGCDVDVVIGGRVDEAVLVGEMGEVVGEDVALWVSAGWTGTIWRAESLGNRDCETEKFWLS